MWAKDAYSLSKGVINDEIIQETIIKSLPWHIRRKFFTNKKLVRYGRYVDSLIATKALTGEEYCYLDIENAIYNCFSCYSSNVTVPVIGLMKIYLKTWLSNCGFEVCDSRHSDKSIVISWQNCDITNNT